MILTKKQLVDLLRTVLAGVEAGDSCEGSLQYSDFNAPDGVEIGRDQFEVTCAIRTGNSQGQGGMLVLCASAPVPVAPRVVVGTNPEAAATVERMTKPCRSCQMPVGAHSVYCFECGICDGAGCDECYDGRYMGD